MPIVLAIKATRIGGKVRRASRTLRPDWPTLSGGGRVCLDLPTILGSAQRTHHQVLTLCAAVETPHEIANRARRWCGSMKIVR